MGAKAKLQRVSVNLPGISGEWTADEDQQRAAWEMYVELVTRISVEPLPGDQGLLNEVLASLHTLFGETRRILRDYGPSIATPEKKKFLSFGAIAVDVLNVWLRPFLTKWHPLLADHEAHRAPGRSQLRHEQEWELAPKLRAELTELRARLTSYADLLSRVCGVPALHLKPE